MRCLWGGATAGHALHMASLSSTTVEETEMHNLMS